MSIIPKYLLNRRGSGGGGGINPNSLKTVGYDSLIKDPLMPVGNVEFGYNQQAQGVPGGQLYVGQQKVSLRTINGQQLVGNTDITINGQANMVSITWDTLVSRRNHSDLVAGTWYRITDYRCFTTQTGTDSAGIPFDIIVRADSASSLSEDAFATPNSDNHHFDQCNLGAWRLKYCIDNDTTRFAWADTTKGKGVVYFMIDEYGNAAPYDFKNIMFIRPLVDGKYDPKGVDTLVYTFSEWDGAKSIDASLNAAEICTNNMVGSYRDFRTNYHLYILPDNVFLNDGQAGYVCTGNRLGLACHGNTIGNSCTDITLTESCSGNVVGDSCKEITMGKACVNVTLGDYCLGVTVSDMVSSCTVTGATSGHFVQRCIILSGDYENSGNPGTITFTSDAAYTQVAGIDSNGQLNIWNPAD